MENKKSINHKESETIVVLTKLPTQVILKEKVESIKGPQGYKGSPGIPGPQGHKGEQGDDGHPGEPSLINGNDGENIYSKRYIYAMESLTIYVAYNNYHILCNGEVTLTYNVQSAQLTIPFLSFVSTPNYDIRIILPSTPNHSNTNRIITKGKKVLVSFFPDQNKWYIFEG